MSNTASNSSPTPPRLILTTGEPAGIGPDLAVEIAQQRFPASLVFITDPDLLLERAGQLGKTIDPYEYRPGMAGEHVPGRIACIRLPVSVPVQPGRPDPRNAGHVLSAITTATQDCLAGDFDAMVTAPVNKAVINSAGQPFTGHTEFIAALCGVKQPVMMLMNQRLRVVLATTHLPLSAVPAAITRDHLAGVITTLVSGLHSLQGIARPRILVCGLNPHAGEAGYLGNEEITVIAPVLEQLRAWGLDITGPVAADTAFTEASLAGTDAVLTMYHDQGLPVLKAMGFGEVVNVTLGLPIIRTSVDHGTALPLAATGKASASSLSAAIMTAIGMVRHRQATA